MDHSGSGSTSKSWAIFLEGICSTHSSRFNITKADGFLSLGPFTKHSNGPDTTNIYESQRSNPPELEHAAKSICWTVNEYRDRMIYDRDPYESAEAEAECKEEENVTEETAMHAFSDLQWLLEDYNEGSWQEWNNWEASRWTAPSSLENGPPADEEGNVNVNASQYGLGEYEGFHTEADTLEEPELNGDETESGYSEDNKSKYDGFDWRLESGKPEWILPNHHSRARIGRILSRLDIQQATEQLGRWLRQIAFYLRSCLFTIISEALELIYDGSDSIHFRLWTLIENELAVGVEYALECHSGRLSEEGVNFVRERRHDLPITNVVLDFAKQLFANSDVCWAFVSAFWIFHRYVPLSDAVSDSTYNIMHIRVQVGEDMMEEDWKLVLGLSQRLSADGGFLGGNPPIFDLHGSYTEAETTFLVYWAVQWMVWALWKREEGFGECIATDYSGVETPGCGGKYFGTYEKLVQ